MFDAQMGDLAARAVNLDADFARIGDDGPRAPTVEAPRAIAFRHPDEKVVPWGTRS